MNDNTELHRRALARWSEWCDIKNAPTDIQLLAKLDDALYQAEATIAALRRTYP